MIDSSENSIDGRVECVVEKITLFGKMKDREFIDRFLNHRRSHPSANMDPESESAYILSGEYPADLDRLSSGDFFFDLPVKKLIPKSLSNEKRTVYCFRDKQKILLQALSFVLHTFDGRFSDCLYSSILGKSFKEYITNLKNDASYGRMYAVKVDISSYGSSIDAGILVEKLRVFFHEDPAVFEFLRWLLERRMFVFEGKIMKGDTSALPGIPVHSFFTNLYLMDMDFRIEPLCRGYCRYSDDILAFAGGVEEAHSLMAAFRSEIERAKLSFNELQLDI